MNTTPTFSIIVPTYNHARFVGPALDSLLAQTDPDWEAVVVNDGSTDDTPEVLARYAAKDGRIRVFHQPNGGTGAALNRALSHARGEWICWLSSDDFFDPKKLAIHREWMRREPTCRFFFTYFRLFNQANNTTVDHQLWGPLPEREYQVLGLFFRNYVSGISICVHRQSWEAIGRFNERLRYAQDYDMWLRLLARYPGTFIPEWTCINRHHSGQCSEIFPQACYYDTAAAGVQFLNEHRFEELFPLLDPSDTRIALKVVEKALNQAADETAFLYWYGAHPCLLSRTLEWAWNNKLGTKVYNHRAPIRELARQIIADTSRQLRGTPLGWHWQVASAATTLPNPDFSYTPMRPIDLGLNFLYDLRAQGKTDLGDLQRYFKMQYALNLPTAPQRLDQRSIVIQESQFTPPPYQDIELARELRAAGCKVVIVRAGPERLLHVEGIPCLEAGSQQGSEVVVRELLPVDTIIWRNGPDDLTTFPARRQYTLATPAHSTAAEVASILDSEKTPSDRCSAITPSVSSNRKKVVFIGARPWGGGAERVTYDLLHAINSEKYELHFVYLFNNETPQVHFDKRIVLHDVERELKSLHMNRSSLLRRAANRSSKTLRMLSDLLSRMLPPQSIRQYLDPCQDSIKQVWPHVIALKQILQRIGSDALLVPIMEEATVRVWLAQAFAKQPYCASLHIAESHYMPVLYPKPERLTIENFFLSSACSSAAAVTLPSQGCKDDLIEHFNAPAANVRVMPNPIDVASILKSCGDVPEVPLPSILGKYVFVHVARLCYQKNHQLLFDACRLLKKRTSNFLVVCLGEGELRAEIEQQIKTFGLQEQVLLLGEVRNPFAYMARAHGLLLTSRFESFALVLVEAMACGAVPISVDCPYGPRDVLDGGKHGLLVPMDDPLALADAMLRVAEDRALREECRQAGVARARQYELANVARQWEQLFDSIDASDGDTRKPIVEQRQSHTIPSTPNQRRKVVFVCPANAEATADNEMHDLMLRFDRTKYELHCVRHSETDFSKIDYSSNNTLHTFEHELKKLELSNEGLWKRGFRYVANHLRQASDFFGKNLRHSAFNPQLDPCLDLISRHWPYVIALKTILANIGSEAVIVPIAHESIIRTWLAQAFLNCPFFPLLSTQDSAYLHPKSDKLIFEHFLLANALQRASVVVSPNQKIALDVRRHFRVPEHRIEILPNSLDSNTPMNGTTNALLGARRVALWESIIDQLAPTKCGLHEFDTRAA